MDIFVLITLTMVIVLCLFLSALWERINNLEKDMFATKHIVRLTQDRTEPLEENAEEQNSINQAVNDKLLTHEKMLESHQRMLKEVRKCQKM